MTSILYENETEKRHHLNAIQSISREIGTPENEVRPLYEQVLEIYKDSARVKDYLPILVSREVRYIFTKSISHSAPYHIGRKGVTKI